MAKALSGRVFSPLLPSSVPLLCQTKARPHPSTPKLKREAQKAQKASARASTSTHLLEARQPRRLSRGRGLLPTQLLAQPAQLGALRLQVAPAQVGGGAVRLRLRPETSNFLKSNYS